MQKQGIKQGTNIYLKYNIACNVKSTIEYIQAYNMMCLIHSNCDEFSPIRYAHVFMSYAVSK